MEQPTGRIDPIEPFAARKAERQLRAILVDVCRNIIHEEGHGTPDEVRDRVLTDKNFRAIYDSNGERLKALSLNRLISSAFQHQVRADEFDGYHGPFTYAIRLNDGGYVYKPWAKLTASDLATWRAEKVAKSDSIQLAVRRVDQRFDDLRGLAEQHPMKTFEEIRAMQLQVGKPQRRKRSA